MIALETPSPTEEARLLAERLLSRCAANRIQCSAGVVDCDPAFKDVERQSNLPLLLR